MVERGSTARDLMGPLVEAIRTLFRRPPPLTPEDQLDPSAELADIEAFKRYQAPVTFENLNAAMAAEIEGGTEAYLEMLRSMMYQEISPHFVASEAMAPLVVSQLRRGDPAAQRSMDALERFASLGDVRVGEVIAQGFAPWLAEDVTAAELDRVEVGPLLRQMIDAELYGTWS